MCVSRPEFGLDQNCSDMKITALLCSLHAFSLETGLSQFVALQSAVCFFGELTVEVFFFLHPPPPLSHPYATGSSSTPVHQAKPFFSQYCFKVIVFRLSTMCLGKGQTCILLLFGGESKGDKQHKTRLEALGRKVHRLWGEIYSRLKSQ